MSDSSDGTVSASPIKAELANDRTLVEGRPNRGDQIELTVESFAHGGAGVARMDGTGYVVFVTGAIPGDRVLAEIGKRKRSFAEARTIELLEPSPDRVEPRGDHPGAPWQVLSYERQLVEKAAQVKDAMVRLGQFEDPPMRDIVPAVEQWRYRNKIEFSFAPDAGAEGGIACGFHPPGEWWRVVDVEDFVLASERMNAARAQVVGWARAHGVAAFDRKTRTGSLRNLVIREGKRTGQLQVRLVVSETGLRSLDLESLIDAVDCDGLLLTRTSAEAEVTHGGETILLAGRERLEEELHGITYRVSAEAFFQTNTEMAEELYALVRDAAALEGWERLVDLYCGIGTIGLTLAPRAAELWGIESIPQAIDDAMEAAQREGYKDRASFVVGDVRIALPALLERGFKPDVAVVDPPRAGLSQKVVRRIVDAAPKRLVYVSCNPTTLAPNARQLVDAGYVLQSVQPVDMFPQTPHIETVAVFERGPNGVQNPDRD
ncbi:MAG: 23S rRNA (uracil(1939)-C(5))-methyltransferase RlmD [Solirubrobacteraceae bacterium]|nr:23S rRNA (uracil(1939)-C(5))-methyltransferase RlmD [Solirubrobacteraceae bacterium]